MDRKFHATLVITGIFLAQLTTGGSYNLGTPQTPGTYVPENSPATVVARPSWTSRPISSPSSAAPASPSAAPGSGSYQGPAYSFGGAPPPLVSPGK
jgi:hypothetical protein